MHPFILQPKIFDSPCLLSYDYQATFQMMTEKELLLVQNKLKNNVDKTAKKPTV